MWRSIYEGLQTHFPAFTVDDWWGITDPFARMAGSILVQNTAWDNAAQALDRLKQAGWLDPDLLSRTSPEQIAEVIRPAGFQRAKSAALIRLSRWIVEKGGMAALRVDDTPTDCLRRELLRLKGIGPETADTILAYALERPTISGDAYSRRLYERLTGEPLSYEGVRRTMLNDLRETEELQRLHGLIVEHGKEICRKRQPRCASCLFAERCQAFLRAQVT
jgi:endonuclease-3 related protein